eukprot:scaffold113263_cov50-Phaeocystis_antarctica.AAC.1
MIGLPPASFDGQQISVLSLQTLQQKSGPPKLCTARSESSKLMLVHMYVAGGGEGVGGEGDCGEGPGGGGDGAGEEGLGGGGHGGGGEGLGGGGDGDGVEGIGGGDGGGEG